MAKVTALVLTGGGAKAAYQAGVIKALSEIFPSEQTPFKIICGTSAGAINAAFLASTADHWKASAQKLNSKWSSLELNDVYRTDSLSVVRIALGWISRTLLGGRFLYNAHANYLLDTSPLRKTLDDGVNFESIRRHIDQGTLMAVSFSTTRYYANESITFYQGSTEIKPWSRKNRFGISTHLNTDHIMASAAIPVFFPPVKINSKYYGDGSLRQTTPLSAAIRLGAEKILSIGVRHDSPSEEHPSDIKAKRDAPPSLAQISGELLNSIFLDSMDTDIERLESVNQSVELIRQIPGGESRSTLKKVDHLHLRPSRDLQSLIPSTIKKFPPIMRFLFRGLGASKNQGNNLMGYLSFLPECSIPLMNLGYEDTLKRKEELLRFFSE